MTKMKIYVRLWTKSFREASVKSTNQLIDGLYGNTVTSCVANMTSWIEFDGLMQGAKTYLKDVDYTKYRKATRTQLPKKTQERRSPMFPDFVKCGKRL